MARFLGNYFVLVAAISAIHYQTGNGYSHRQKFGHDQPVDWIHGLSPLLRGKQAANDLDEYVAP